MTSPQSFAAGDLAPGDSLSVGAEATVANADRLGLTWKLRPATVAGGADPTVVSLTLDGDDVLTVAYSLIGPLNNGARVMVMMVPPSGAYVTGVIGSQVTSNVQSYRYVPASPQVITGTTLTTLVGSDFTFTKWGATTSLLLSLSTAGRATTAGGGYAAVVAATMNATPYEVTTLLFNVTDSHAAFSHDFKTGVLPAGEYSIILQARTSLAAKTYITDQNDLTTLTVTEVL